jgi:hypothetical protein
MPNIEMQIKLGYSLCYGLTARRHHTRISVCGKLGDIQVLHMNKEIFIAS